MCTSSLCSLILHLLANKQTMKILKWSQKLSVWLLLLGWESFSRRPKQQCSLGWKWKSRSVGKLVLKWCWKETKGDGVFRVHLAGSRQEVDGSGDTRESYIKSAGCCDLDFFQNNWNLGRLLGSRWREEVSVEFAGSFLNKAFSPRVFIS